MITKFKIFESSSETPQIGDYVICENHDIGSSLLLKDLQEFLDSNIGIVVEIQEGIFSDYFKNFYQIEDGNGYKIKFDDVPFDIANDFCTEDEGVMMFNSNEIVYHSSRKEDCEAYFTAKKYNL